MHAGEQASIQANDTKINQAQLLSVLSIPVPLKHFQSPQAVWSYLFNRGMQVMKCSHGFIVLLQLGLEACPGLGTDQCVRAAGPARLMLHIGRQPINLPANISSKLQYAGQPITIYSQGPQQQNAAGLHGTAASRGPCLSCKLHATFNDAKQSQP